MTVLRKINFFLWRYGILLWALVISSCEHSNQEVLKPFGSYHLSDFPEFITPTEKYFKLNIRGNHDIDPDSYRLKISGGVNHPAEFSLEQLQDLKMVEKTVTVECIDNNNNGLFLLGTVTWKGFSVYSLLDSLGIKDGVTFVKYHCSDGYFTYNTLEELQNREVLGALYMNGKTIPQNYGFPLRIIFPGFYGVRQPGWVVEIELVENGIMDYWGQTQFEKWNTDSSMAIDSKIFFPANYDTFALGENVRIGGAAYGSRRISSVDITVDNGKTWIPAIIKQSMDEDYVWVFWEVNYTPLSPGPLIINSRSTATDGRVQPQEDYNYLDGTNSWPAITIFLKNGS